MPDRNDNLETRMARVEERLTTIKHALWGVRGDNGMIVDLRAVRRDFEAWRKEEVERRREERVGREERAHQRARDDEDAKRERFRNRLTGLGIAITGTAAMTTAILTVLRAGG